MLELAFIIFPQHTNLSISAARNQNKKRGVVGDTIFCLISLGIASIASSAVFLYVGFLFLVPPSEDMRATKMGPHEATQSVPAPVIPSHKVTLLANSTPYEATQPAPAPALPGVTPNDLASASQLFAVYTQRAKEEGVTYEQYRDARMQYLQKQQAGIELRLTDPTLSTAERSRLERRKAYWGRAIQQMLALP
jgi:hypothetical protein